MRDKIRILFLSANPVDKGMLRLGEEVRAFDEKMKAGDTRDTFELIQQRALRPRDLPVALLRHRPHIVHFSGHQSLSEDIILEDDKGKSKHISGQDLADLFKSFKDIVQVVFFDACFTKSQAEAISRFIDFTIGTSKAIDDRTAITFASTFYQALAFGRSVSDAFKLAKAQVDLAQIRGGDTPKLLIREGVDQEEPFLSLSEDADEKASERLRTALVNLASGKATKAQASLIRRALIDGRVVIEQLEETVTGEPPTSDSESTSDVMRESAKGDIRATPSQEVTRTGTKEDLRVGVSESAYGRIQQQLYPAPQGLPPPVPGLTFVGRENSLTDVKKLLGVGQEQQTSTVTVVRGWPGVGKTTFVGVLAHDPEITKAFPDGVLWTALGQSPDLMSTIAQWGRFFGAEDLLRVPELDEATQKLARLLGNKQMLLILDDVWNSAHALPFMRTAIASKCALLTTTQLTSVANDLAQFDSSRSPDENIYVLPVLTEEEALTLLRLLAPAAVESHFAACLELVRDLECLPLALQVAGRLLNEEWKMGLDAVELITEITEGAKLFAEPAPLDRAEGAVIPTVGALLQRSTAQLDELTRDCFAYLGAFAPKPSTFDSGAMKAVWMVDDPTPIIRKLVGQGLLEPVGAGRFQIHSLLVQHALTLLS